MVTEYLTPEADFIPWSAAITGLAYLENMMKRSEGFGELRHYLLNTLQKSHQYFVHYLVSKVPF